MKQFTIVKLAAAAALAVTATVLALSQVFGQELAADRVTVAPGAQGQVKVEALDIGAPGLGAWEIDVTYDAALVTPLSCQEMAGSVCNVGFASGVVRITGATAAGHVGDTTLATITFRCGTTEGTSGVGLSVAVFADATIGAPRPIVHSVDHGSVSCAEGGGVDEPTTRPPATPTDGGGGDNGDDDDDDGPGMQLPDTGSGSAGGGNVNGWLIAALATSGFALAAGVGALRLRPRANR